MMNQDSPYSWLDRAIDAASPNRGGPTMRHPWNGRHPDAGQAAPVPRHPGPPMSPHQEFMQDLRNVRDENARQLAEVEALRAQIEALLAIQARRVALRNQNPPLGMQHRR